MNQAKLEKVREVHINNLSKTMLEKEVKKQQEWED